MLESFTATERTGIALVSLALLGSALALTAIPARAAITPTSSADTLAGAVASQQGLVTGASFINRPPGAYGVSTAAVSDTPLAGFATDGGSYAILTTGDPRIADDPNDSAHSGVGAGGGHFQGVHNYDVTVLRIDVDVPAGDDCLSVDYRFLSEEFDEYVGGGYNDTFMIQLDRYDWDAAAQKVSNPGDFATDGDAVGIDSSGPYSVSAERSTGTTYDAATDLIGARTRVTPGAHSIYLSIFDQGDPVYDSAAFVDRLTTSHETGRCGSPEAPPNDSPDDSPDDPPDEGAGSGESTEGLPASGGEWVESKPVRAADPRSRIASFRRIKARRLKYFNGTAAAGAGVARVQIALVGTKRRARRSRRGKKARRCVQTDSRRQIRQVISRGKKCSRLRWVTVKGTDSWTFKLRRRRLPKGRYKLYSRAIDRSGVAERHFSAANGNRISFTVY